MAVTEKGVVREVNEVLSGFRVAATPAQIEVAGRRAFLARYTAESLHGKVENPVRRGVLIGLAMVATLSDYAARHTHTSVVPRYRLATQEKARDIRGFRPVTPEHFTEAPSRFSLEPKAVVSILADHCLWLASQDASKRREIPGLLEKRLVASAQDPQRHVDVAVSSALDTAAGVAASVNVFERENGIRERRNNVAGFAIYGYDLGDYVRLSATVDTFHIGRP